MSGMFGGGNNNNAAEAARAQQAQQQAELESQRAAFDAKQKADAQNMTTRDASKKRQTQQAVGATGGRDTILTGALGDTSPTPGTKKTLLGL